jgi:hypothetical protein
MVTPRKKLRLLIHTAPDAHMGESMDERPAPELAPIISKLPEEARQAVGAAFAEFRALSPKCVTLSQELEDLAVLDSCIRELLERLARFPTGAEGHAAYFAIKNGRNFIEIRRNTEGSLKLLLDHVEVAAEKLGEHKGKKSGRPSTWARDRLVEQLAGIAGRFAPDRYKNDTERLEFAVQCTEAMSIATPRESIQASRATAKKRDRKKSPPG